jgi:ubiquinone biosynthesis monooxygenase Coq7
MVGQLSTIDRWISAFDVALRAICVPPQRVTKRPSPAKNLANPVLDAKETRHVAGLMRVNHAGEVCAQALYQGQALAARLTAVKVQMNAAALEEVDHLAWCETRLRELGSTPGLFNPIWYLGSFMMGSLAGWVGDQWSLGFVAETERQVGEHLQKHLTLLPAQDQKTRAILYQMQKDEAQHAEMAMQAGAAELPAPIKFCMRFVSKIMTKTTYYF